MSSLLVPVLWAFGVIGLILGVGGCQKTYYTALEKIGVEKREVLERRVEKAKESQQEAQEEFKSALEQFKSVVDFDGGELERQYERMDQAYESAKSQADEVGDRIDSVENVAEALFDEWEEELEQYRDESLREKSAAKLADTRRRYRKLVRTMRNAESTLEPVLARLHDHVLYLKHNLNAAAISSLKDEVPKLEGDIERLVREMDSAIAEADDFLTKLE